eukprot:CAMPEP_0170247422 /NCGR_PEP_ID=MMETSP0116_2-20130129/23500_1 /TAXON_ID=400756 /ORGANISM="Durinskia baltica, Strain CSIRO CS-38" /LENGTH=533 /DNA_ID=CAMNT_0010498303 /DNA_START=11 /DNA_END=1611 /DNA_ORIENTATION=+
MAAFVAPRIAGGPVPMMKASPPTSAVSSIESVSAGNGGRATTSGTTYSATWLSAAAAAATAALGWQGVVAANSAGRRGGKRAAAMRRRATDVAWEAGRQDERTFGSPEQFMTHLTPEAKLPAGFRVGTAKLTFVPQEAPEMGKLPMTLTVLALDEPTDAYAAVFTTNAFPGAPVLVGRRRLLEGRPLQGVVVNNKVSNVFPSDGGEASSEAVCAAAADCLGFSGGASSVLPSSTGVIGWRLPVEEMKAAMPAAAAALQADSVLPAARGIMTTDRYAKVSAVEFPGGGRIVGIAKGAGMIEPNMATMLCYILTDVEPPPGGRVALQRMLADAVRTSFNSCSIDGDTSTSDTVVLLSSRRAPAPPQNAFEEALGRVCRDLAGQVVRNGEGTQHVMRVFVTGAANDDVARSIGKAVVNGPLFKSAVAGNDPNVGRLVAKVGQALGTNGAAMASGCLCRIGGETIFENGHFTLDGAKEKRLAEHLRSAQVDSSLKYPPHHRVVDIEVRLGGGGRGTATVMGSDLTKEYVEINGDYRS